ncbi:DUF2793 domain-containing protein [uncultured Paracoccus sp.]|uniref:DUF2793 domain-containing protein n=1 Tax=uncultured Paracoccus sp. TaxID=189685 RepID=UPI00261B05AF|nr:DUF2793 domain-containing protein [uncultured Paracoccus sp.]
MSDQSTARCGLPLLQPAQAQKHVTVNDALMRLDGLVNLVLESVTRAAPPDEVADGLSWGIPASATGAWQGRGGQVAIAANGGWVFAIPRAGQRGFVRDAGLTAVHDGAGWVRGTLTLGAYGSALCAGMAEAEVVTEGGTIVDSGLIIPAAAMVIGCTARVVEAIGGTLQSWALGTAGATDRFGSGLGLAQGSWARGMLSQPMTYWDPASLMLTAAGGSFGGGRVRVAAHWLELRLPI